MENFILIIVYNNVREKPIGTGNNCCLDKRTAARLWDTGGAEPEMSALILGFALTGLCDT